MSYLSIALLLFSFIAAGCADSKAEPLQMKNVLQFDQERKAVRAQHEAADQLVLEEEARQREVLAKQKPFTVAELYENSLTEPKEAVFFDPPAGFVKFTPAEVEELMADEHFQKFYSGLVPVWHAVDHDLVILMAQTESDPQEMTQWTREEFKAKLEAGREEYRHYYRMNRDAPVAFEMKDRGGAILELRVASKFLEEGDWRFDERLTFFYRPEYRYNVVFKGLDADHEKFAPELAKSLELFRERLSKQFYRGIAFKKTEE